MAVSRFRPLHVALLLPLVAVAAWVAWRAQTQRNDPATVLAALRAAAGPTLPESQAVGAASRTAAAHYSRDTLSDFIDGAAEAYLGRGFEQAVAASYSFAGQGATFEITAEVHRFASPSGAAGQLEAERPVNASPATGIEQAWTDGTTLLALRGRDYFKLTALATTPAAGAAMLPIAAVWCRKAPR